MGDTHAKSLAEVDTLYSADSIEFCPTPGYEKWFTCGTYQLLKPDEADKPKEEVVTKTKGDSEDDDDDSEDEEDVTPPAPRIGRLYLFSLDETTPTEAQRIETAAILDAKWAPLATAPELSVADAKGGLTTYALTDTESGPRLSETQKLQVADDSILVLSLDHSKLNPGQVMTSLSNGKLAHLVRDDTGELTVAAEWAAHDFEPWITAWDGRDDTTVWSGGDDCKLKRWDTRMPGISTAVTSRFDGGVTTIAPSPHREHLMAVGSYDAQLRLFDARQPNKPLLEVELPGGIWRTRWHPSVSRSGDILNACMHGGFAVVHLGDGLVPGEDVGEIGADQITGEVLTTFPGTLGYGADWCRRGDLGETSVVATCSFYDHVMHVWRA